MIACAALEAIAKNYCVSLCYCASVYAVACALPVVTILHNAVEERQSLVKQVNLLFAINQLLDFCYCLFIIFPALYYLFYNSYKLLCLVAHNDLKFFRNKWSLWFHWLYCYFLDPDLHTFSSGFQINVLN